jgi:hypothetical protein
MQRARDPDQRFDTGSVIVPLEACLYMENPLRQRIPRTLLDFPRDSAGLDPGSSLKNVNRLRLQVRLGWSNVLELCALYPDRLASMSHDTATKPVGVDSCGPHQIGSARKISLLGLQKIKPS